MLGVGDRLPAFKVLAAKPGFMNPEENGENAFEEITETSFEGKWKLIYFYPKDFTFVCPTEIVEFANIKDDLEDRDCVLHEIGTAGSSIELVFEQQDQDGFVIQVRPWRNDLAFVARMGYWAQITFELYRFCPDPDRLRRAQDAGMKSYYAGLYGRRGTRIGGSPTVAPLAQPGVFSLRTVGNKIHVSMGLIVDVGSYAGADGAFDRPRIEADLDGVSHGLEKCMQKLTSVPAATA